jgi:hypothetical protein
LSDQTVAKYPINTTIMPGCGSKPDVVEYTPPTGKAGVNCYGIKSDDNEQVADIIHKFNRSKWSRHD